MSFLVIAFSKICALSSSALIKSATSNGKCNSPMKFNALKTGSTFAFFALIFVYGLKFHMPTFAFASCYGVFYALSTHFGYMALATGPMSLSSLIASYNIIIPWFFGITFLNEKAGIVQIAGFLLLVVSMFLIMKKNDRFVISKKWLVFIGITFLSNGICAITQKMHQTMYPSQFYNEFTVYSLCVLFLLFLIISVSSKEQNLKGVTKFAVLSGVLVGISEYLILLLSATMDASVLFPVSTILAALFNVIISRIFFKEKLSPVQLVGIVTGVISILLIK